MPLSQGTDSILHTVYQQHLLARLWALTGSLSLKAMKLRVEVVSWPHTVVSQTRCSVTVCKGREMGPAALLDLKVNAHGLRDQPALPLEAPLLQLYLLSLSSAVSSTGNLLPILLDCRS